MRDARSFWCNGRVAHNSLKGQVDAVRFSAGQDHRVLATPVAELRNAPDGKIERQLLTGARFCVLDVEGDWAFGFARANGYTGYIKAHMLSAETAPATHIIRNRMSMARDVPDFKTRTKDVLLSMGSVLTVTEDDGTWQRIEGFGQPLYLPSSHTRPLTDYDTDPVTIASDLLGTPYVWGGDSAIGIDCSGLIQIACSLCGISCPGDSDQQERTLGTTLPPGTPPQRGDLFFWKGHVAWVSDPNTILHANAHHMAVAYEPLQAALARIDGQGDGRLTRHARLRTP